MSEDRLQLDESYKPPTGLLLSVEDVRAVYRIIKDQWINRDDDKAMEVSDAISRFIREVGE